MSQTNPLLDLSGLPRYDAIRPEHVNPALDVLLEDARKAVAAAETVENPTWDNFVAPSEDAMERLGSAWGAVAHLQSVVMTPELREVYNANIGRISNFYAELGQNENLYARWKALAASADFAGYSETRKTIVEHAIRDFKLSGAELPDEQKERFMQIEERSSELTSKFSQNVLDATDAFALYIDDESQLAGLPDDWKAATRAAAEAEGKAGWKITLKMPSYLPVMQFAENRALREQLYRAYVTRASEFGPAENDNTPLINEIHALRQEGAQLLGFNNFSEESLATKMAESPAQVLGFLRDLAQRAKPHMQSDRAEMESWAKANLGYATLEAWDVAFVSERIREQKYAFSEQEVKQYFTEPTVLSGLFHLIETLYGLQFVPAEASVWHKDVRFYRLQNKDGSEVGGLFVDLYAREGKQGGAWMNDVRGRRKLADGCIQTPVALIVCNFAQGVDGKPALLPHDDVITLFHEMGHALHHLLTEVDELSVAGISGVEWDAVELPSQFMENFCWEWQVLPKLTHHIDSGESLPRALYDKMLAAKNFQSGSIMQRQLYFSIFDMALHGDTSQVNAQAQATAIQQELGIPLPPDYNRFPQSFSHIFAGGYAAGYYSYKWAEVLSADAYAAFEEEAEQSGSVVDPAVGARFRAEILARGGSRPALESFKAFRGRAPEIDALLRHNGLAG
ncbi:oligopeptidase A [Andreprevotia lacus DSM 23236]|jgi:oligopeptidase A|uniref:oligopeptidase A n=1 Tax=Andreprevotia lacus DSM 23236 TaxID=1121001 RepID=A0A1W1XQJ4_9NEIS|nr:M3 family metallopeptidase [Andreprevotia lacus]SMC26260.1 oligopeptidase A [Andreprevotia lacus DSM 23236]